MPPQPSLWLPRTLSYSSFLFFLFSLMSPLAACIISVCNSSDAILLRVCVYLLHMYRYVCMPLVYSLCRSVHHTVWYNNTTVTFLNVLWMVAWVCLVELVKAPSWQLWHWPVLSSFPCMVCPRPQLPLCHSLHTAAPHP